MANYTKIFLWAVVVQTFIIKPYARAVYGMERLMGRTDSPLGQYLTMPRKTFKGYTPCLLPDCSIKGQGKNQINGLFIGQGRQTLSRQPLLARG